MKRAELISKCSMCTVIWSVLSRNKPTQSKTSLRACLLPLIEVHFRQNTAYFQNATVVKRMNQHLRVCRFRSILIRLVLWVFITKLLICRFMLINASNTGGFTTDKMHSHLTTFLPLKIKKLWIAKTKMPPIIISRQ